ncbi:hypothetical protein MCOR27_006953 [Pyricularia oryzae]|uniref:MYND-type domain-containing protein n=2 Tax=Pyricularia TaxID=48558 RepID=A0ABQ8N5Q2_PYRGI|nr:hypothetical protein MCOR19_004783 [Pyricularia oryzae]KAI6290815.1 hypothetical protein MCOR33_011026 [Pyricularia grisea]KAI6275429.1 hypothetical protein MCOR27_006953 [Pyricularia oryzae]KAI6286612.1 hypothetical protein MCOR26_001001 [Pyricularia oryzae]KAI6307497.1 hypothetical protein MCOR29_009677 [Pyricularia oryzae]
MGRWGHRLFEGDLDLDLVGDIEREMKKAGLPKVELEAMLYKPTSDEYRKTRDALVADGVGDAIVTHLRSRADRETGYLKSDLEYKSILTVALLLGAGSKIDQQHLEYVKALTGEVQSREGFAHAIWDHGFRGPGKRQFLAALNAYQPGVCRDLGAPSCFTCGKTKQDTDKVPSTCGKCKGAWYCNKDCQRSHWKYHKKSCRDPNDSQGLPYVMMNV